MSMAGHVVAFLVAVVAGAFGSALGIGGGLFLIPSLTLFLHVKLKVAIAASIVAVIATSVTGGSVYVRRQIADIRLGLLLALATTPGAIAGAVVSAHANARVLSGLFAVMLAVSASQMIKSTVTANHGEGQPEALEARRSRLHLRREYLEPSTGLPVRYDITRVPLGIAVSTFAGVISGLLGVGGGIVQVPVMNLLMHVPMKVASATSTYIIGITAMAAAFVYYNGRPSFIDPTLAVPVTIGVVLGATAGSLAMQHIQQRTLRAVFTIVLALYTVQMVLRVIGLIGD